MRRVRGLQAFVAALGVVGAIGAVSCAGSSATRGGVAHTPQHGAPTDAGSPSPAVGGDDDDDGDNGDDGDPSAAAALRGPGLSRREAIEVCRPEGEYALVQRLRCDNGEPATAERVRSVGPRNPLSGAGAEQEMIRQVSSMAPPAAGHPDYHIVDRFRVRCGEREVEVFVDMYHCEPAAEPRAPQGFSLAPVPVEEPAGAGSGSDADGGEQQQ